MKFKHALILLLCLVLAVSTLPVAYAETEKTPAEISRFAANRNEDEYKSSVLKGYGKTKPALDYKIANPIGQISPYRLRGAAVNNSCGAGLTWKIESNTLTISGKGKMTDFDSDNLPGWKGKNFTAVVIKKGVESVGEMAFYDCNNLQSVSLPSTVKKLGKLAFAECWNLSKINIPSSVKTLPYAVFAECNSLRQLNLNSITEIEDYAFESVPLDTFTVGKNLKSISSLAFFKADIKQFKVTKGNTVFSEKNSVLYSDGGKTLFMYPAGNQATSFSVPSQVTKIASAAMAYAYNLESVNLSSNVKTLESSAFQGASIESITIPDSVTSAGDFTFYDCDELTSVTFGKGLKNTSYEMFEECSSLKTINFGKGLKKLDARTFAYCDSLEDIVLPATITAIGNGTFGECYSLTSFSSPSITCVPFQAFLNCLSLTNFNVLKVTDIYRASFYGCDSLKSVTLPKSVKYVHFNAFPDHTKITCKDKNMEKFGTNGYRYLDHVSLTGTRNYNMAYQVLSIVNKKRKEAGLSKLTMDKSLLESAMRRAAECAVCFSHTRPDSSICFEINNKMIAENIAAGQDTSKEVMQSWMNSDGHRSNILLSDAKSIGIGSFTHNGNTFWVQCFGAEKAETGEQPSNSKKTQTISIATEPFEEAVAGIDLVISIGVGDDESSEYAYKFTLNLNKTSIKEKATAKASIELENAGWPYACAKLNNTGITWLSSDPKVASVNSSGTVTAIKSGKAKITAKLKHYKVSKNITVISTVPPAAPKTLKASKTTTSVKLTWSKVTGAKGYRVYKYDTKTKKYVKLADTTKTTYTIKKLKAGTTYKYQVKAYKKSGNTTLWSAAKKISVTTPKIDVPKTLKASQTTTSIKLTWSKVTGVTGYRVYKYDAKTKKYVKVADTTKTAYTINKLKAGTTYKYQVKAYGKSGKTTIWSAAKSLTTATKPATPSLTVKAGTKKATLSWKKITGSTGYELYMATSKNGKYTKITTISKGATVKYTKSKLTKGKTYYFKMRAVEKVSGKNIYSAYSSVKSVKVK